MARSGEKPPFPKRERRSRGAIDMNKTLASGLLTASDSPPADYDRAPTFDKMIREIDVYVPMRDGVKLCVDVYRPDTSEKLPALLAFAIYNKDFQGPEIAEALPPQPAWAPLWTGPLEAGDTHFLVSRGYVHVIGSPRGVGKSEGGGSREWDSYDLIEWIAAQPWCDGNVGMVGISGFGAEQFHVAKQQPPHLKAIFPFDPRGAYGVLGGFREEYPGGMLHMFRYLVGHFSAMHQHRGAPGPLPEPKETHWREAMSNPDYRMYPNVYNLVAQKGQHMPPYFDLLIDPHDKEEAVTRAEDEFSKIKVPFYTGSGWYGYTYKTHLNGAQSYFANASDAPKKLMFTGPAHLERPFHSFHREILKWHDHWLKGIDTGVMREPPVKFWVMGENAWRTADDWPLPETEWTKIYLRNWERLSSEPFTPASADEFVPPDAFVQMPPTQTNVVQKLRYLSDPLPHDVLIAGPSVLNLYAEIDQDDTNWIVILKDVGPDVSVMSVREGEREVPKNLPEREVTRGWLKASHRALDPKRSKPWKPWHPLTRAARKPVVPGETVEYAIEIMATANLFRRGHRICLEITSLDLPTGVAGATNAEYVPYHICSSRTVLHKVYHDVKRPSHLLLPVIPTGGGSDQGGG
jgi:predicted acyl esterase